MPLIELRYLTGGLDLETGGFHSQVTWAPNSSVPVTMGAFQTS